MIAVTGINGFVGKNLSRYLSNLGFVVKALSIPQIDINQNDKIQLSNDFFGEYDVLIHLAGKAHDTKDSSDPASYYLINTMLTKKVFDAFLVSNAKTFIFLSSVKAVADSVSFELTENVVPEPITHYGKSKLFAENYILTANYNSKRIYILRPCMIHGIGNKGNLNLLYKLSSRGLPWPLGVFKNERSFCSIDNLLFIVKELIEREDIPSGVYNIADDDTLSTNEIISLIAKSHGLNPKIWNIPKTLLIFLAKLGDLLSLPINSERLKKLTENYKVSNKKLKLALRKEFPINAHEGMIKTIESFKNKI
jgi:nucleoside-diphosphate-sugar epimerase